MDIESRNQSWQGGLRVFQKPDSRTGKTQTWSVRVDSTTVSCEWGQLGGKMQSASESFPDGKTALEKGARKCLLKWREKYLEIDPDTGSYIDHPSNNEMDFDNLPMSLTFYKPDNTMGSAITKLAEAGKALYARKRNGLMYVLARGSGLPKLYSRRMFRQHDDEVGTPLTWDDRFPHIIQAASEIMPPNSILLGELVMNRPTADGLGADDFAHVQSITKSLTAQSLQDQEANGRPSFCVWDVAFWEGADKVSSCEVHVRYGIIVQLLGSRTDGPLIPIQVYDANSFPKPESAVKFAQSVGWEGFVVVNPNGIYGDRAYNFRGKPDRPGTVCAKLKPEFEDDFIAIWNPEMLLRDLPGSPIIPEKNKNDTVGERSNKARYESGIKSVALFQVNPEGRLVYISNVSSGLTEEAKTVLARSELWPRVWRVAYNERSYARQGDDSNALIFAKFMEERTDKSQNECVNPNL